MKKTRCPKCGKIMLADKYCSYQCLEEKAKQEGRHIEELMQEMQEFVNKVWDEVKDKNKN